jgi:hypothetical protein
MRARSVAEYAMLAKGLLVNDVGVRSTIAEQVRWALMRLEKRGLVRRVIVSLEVWCELAGQHGRCVEEMGRGAQRIRGGSFS